PRWGDLAGRLGEPAAPPADVDLGPTVLAAEQVRLEPAAGAVAELARHVQGGIALRIVGPSADHRSRSLKSSPRNTGSERRARCRRDSTVPRGTPIALAASDVDNPAISTSAIAIRCPSSSDQSARSRAAASSEARTARSGSVPPGTGPMVSSDTSNGRR